MVVLSINMTFSQTYTEKYNSYLNRYELYDSSGQLIGYKKYNPYTKSYEIKYFNTQQGSSYIEPIDTDFLMQAMLYKQKQYDTNLPKIQDKVNSIHNLFDKLDEMDCLQARQKSEEIDKVRDNFNSYIKEANGFLNYIDLNSSNTSRIINRLDRYHSQLRDISKQIIADIKDCENKMKQTVTFYNSFSEYPKSVRDGWHIVHVMNNKDYYVKAKVYVQNNKITKYIVNNWFEAVIEYANTITNAKSVIKLNGYGQEYKSVYFLDYLNNPNTNASPPEKSGRYILWQDFKNGGNTKVWVNDEYAGEITTYSSEAPTCSSKNTFVYFNKVGTYKYKAKNNDFTWTGTFTIEADECKTKKLLDGEKGTVHFVSHYGKAGKISIYTKEFLGSVDNLENELTKEHYTGTYYYSASSSKGYRWSGYVTINPSKTTTVILDKNNLDKKSKAEVDEKEYFSHKNTIGFHYNYLDDLKDLNLSSLDNLKLNSFGVRYMHNLYKRLKFGIGLDYTKHKFYGQVYSYSSGGTSDVFVDEEFVNMPIFLHWDLFESYRKVGLGLYVNFIYNTGFLLDQKIKYLNSDHSRTNNGLDIGLGVGGGIKIHLGRCFLYGEYQLNTMVSAVTYKGLQVGLAVRL